MKKTWLLAWAAAVPLAGLEGLLAWNWLWGTAYVLKYGAAENPYAAEDAEIAGIVALLVLPLFTAALVWAVYGTIEWRKERVQALISKG